MQAQEIKPKLTREAGAAISNSISNFIVSKKLN
jgi:hypothetical protein